MVGTVRIEKKKKTGKSVSSDMGDITVTWPRSGPDSGTDMKISANAFCPGTRARRKVVAAQSCSLEFETSNRTCRPEWGPASILHLMPEPKVPLTEVMQGAGKGMYTFHWYVLTSERFGNSLM
eukprot:1151112-Pelagomonas_calceolata.AAC.2